MYKLYKNVFLIDDSKMDLALIRQAFVQNEFIHKVRCFNNSLDFIKYCRGFKFWRSVPELILLDWNMPEASGLEVLKVLRDIKKYKNTPVVVLSSADEKTIRAESEGYEISGVIKKPDGYGAWVELINSIEQRWLEEPEDTI